MDFLGGIFWNFGGNFFGVFLEDFFGGMFMEEFFGRIFLREIFFEKFPCEKFFGGGILGKNSLFTLLKLFEYN